MPIRLPAWIACLQAVKVKAQISQLLDKLDLFIRCGLAIAVKGLISLVGLDDEL